MDEVYAGVLYRIAEAEAESPLGGHVERVLVNLAATHSITTEQLREVWYRMLKACADDALGTSSRTVDEAPGVGERAANAGRGLSESLQLVQELRHLAMECLREQAVAEGRDEEFVIAGFNRIAVSMNTFMLGFSSGYFRAEVANQTRLRTQQDTFVWSVLSGTTGEDDAFNRLGAYGLDGSVPYWAFRAQTDTDADIAELERFLGLAGQGPNRRGVSTMIDGDLCGFATTLPDEPGNLLIGVSGPVPFAALPAAFRRASRAFNVAKLANASGLQSLESLGIVASIMTDRDVAGVLTATYLQPLRRLGEYGETLLDTIRCYIENDCQVDATARDLVLHVNSVRYRISKFEEILGVSMRETKTLAEVWWALQLPDELSSPIRAVSVGDL